MVGVAKLKSNPENNIGLLSLADTRVLVTLTNEMGKVLTKLHQVKPKGSVDLIRGIKVANLALKHRQGKNHKPRVVLFLASPIQVEQAEFIKLAKRLKKEKVNIDIVNFGEEEANRELLNEFVTTINGKEGTGSHLISIAAPTNLADALLQSPVVQGEDGSGLPAGFGPGYQYGMEDDPELAMALRISMEEQRLKQEAEVKKSDTGEKMETEAKGISEEDAMLQQALALSRQDTTPVMPDISSMTEDEQLNYALQMSIAQANLPASDTLATSSVTLDADMKEEDEDLTKAMNDPEFLQRVISGLPGVDPNSEAVKSAMDSLKDTNKDNEKK